MGSQEPIHNVKTTVDSNALKGSKCTRATTPALNDKNDGSGFWFGKVNWGKELPAFSYSASDLGYAVTFSSVCRVGFGLETTRYQSYVKQDNALDIRIEPFFYSRGLPMMTPKKRISFHGAMGYS